MAIGALTLGATSSIAADGTFGLDVTVKSINADSPSLMPTTIAGQETIPDVIGQIVSKGLSLVGVLFFLLALYAGFTWMTALGNSENVTKAQGILEAAVIGLALVSAAYAITRFVFYDVLRSAPGSATPAATPAPSPEDRLAQIGEQCKSNDDCDSRNCEGNQCVAPLVGLGGDCRADGDCGSGSCVGGKCVLALAQLGDTCQADSDCDSNNCLDGECSQPEPTPAPQLAALGGACKANSDCQNNNCVNALCSAPLATVGGACQADGDCASNHCKRQKCISQSDFDLENQINSCRALGDQNSCADPCSWITMEINGHSLFAGCVFHQWADQGCTRIYKLCADKYHCGDMDLICANEHKCDAMQIQCLKMTYP